jgi:serine/threonine protein phosphatase 1
MLYAIGDIHGMREKLVELLEMLPLNPDDHLLFIGDYVDRGPDPKGTIDLLLGVRERYRCTFLLGNHESMFLSFLGWKERPYFGGEAYLVNGGETTLASYGYFSARGEFRLPTEHEEFFRGCRLWHVEGPYAFVHAGVSRKALEASDVGYALSHEDPRELLWERYTMQLPHKLGCTIVYGHTPQADLEIRWNLPYSIGIDTGCVFGGALTAIRLPDETVFQV